MFAEEDYVSLETAKMLKEKGFNEPCNASVLKDGTLRMHDRVQSWDDMMHTNEEYLEFLAPTLYEAQKWLLSKGYHIAPRTYETKGWYFVVYRTNDSTMVYSQFTVTDKFFTSYQQALDAGIRKALELI